MEKNMIIIHDIATGNVIEREMNAEELQNYENIREEKRKIEEERVEAEAQAATNKAALLARLGMTAEEARLLLS
jgi:hypothetical protein